MTPFFTKNKGEDLETLTKQYFNDDTVYLKQVSSNCTLVYKKDPARFNKMFPIAVWKNSFYYKTDLQTQGVFPTVLATQQANNDEGTLKQVMFAYLEGNKYSANNPVHNHIVADALLILKNITASNKQEREQVTNTINEYWNLFNNTRTEIVSYNEKVDNKFYLALQELLSLPIPKKEDIFCCLTHGDLHDKNIIINKDIANRSKYEDYLYETSQHNNLDVAVAQADLITKFGNLVTFIDIENDEHLPFGIDVVKRIALHKDTNLLTYIVHKLNIKELKCLYFTLMFYYVLLLKDNSYANKEVNTRNLFRGCEQKAQQYFKWCSMVCNRIKILEEEQCKQQNRIKL